MCARVFVLAVETIYLKIMKFPFTANNLQLDWWKMNIYWMDTTEIVQYSLWINFGIVPLEYSFAWIKNPQWGKKFKSSIIPKTKRIKRSHKKISAKIRWSRKKPANLAHWIQSALAWCSTCSKHFVISEMTIVYTQFHQLFPLTNEKECEHSRLSAQSQSHSNLVRSIKFLIK